MAGASSAAEGAFNRDHEVTLAAGEVKELPLALDLDATVAGVVVDEQGAPAPGVYVRLDTEDSSDRSSAVSDAHGRFEVRSLAGGARYLARLGLRGSDVCPLDPVEGERFAAIEVGAGAHVTGVRLQARLGLGHLAGVVLDGAGAPAAGARIEAICTTQGSGYNALVPLPTTLTGADGRVRLDGLQAGTWNVRALGVDGTTAVIARIPLGAEDVRVKLPAVSEVRGKLVGFKGEPRLSLRRVGRGGSTPPPPEVTGDRLRIEAVPPGSYLLEARDAVDHGFARFTADKGQPVEVDVARGDRARITGRVVDVRTGRGVAALGCFWGFDLRDVTGSSDAHAEPGPTTTDADGRFTLEAAPPGEVDIACLDDWHRDSSGTVSVELSPGVDAQVEIPIVMLGSGRLGRSGMKIDGDNKVGEVEADGPAARAGLAKGDVVLAVDGRKVDRLNFLAVRFLVEDRAAGTRAKLLVRRAGEEHEVELVIEAPR
jgi:hypothetical protein